LSVLRHLRIRQLLRSELSRALEPVEARVAALEQNSRADVKRLHDIDAVTGAWSQGPNRDARIDDHLARCIRTAGLSNGRALEIGGRKHPRHHLFPGPSWEYVELDLEPGPGHLVADITGCPEVPDASFDVIVSVDVFEHITRPWKAAEEIARLLRPGGLSYTSTLFSWRYHPCPIDYWRFTPDCLAFLFEGLETIDVGFDTTERRRDVNGHGRADRLPEDALGGWRENWRVHHVGRKPGAGAG
jgi:SAM-dependent methyltransferase